MLLYGNTLGDDCQSDNCGDDHIDTGTVPRYLLNFQIHVQMYLVVMILAMELSKHAYSIFKYIFCSDDIGVGTVQTCLLNDVATSLV